MEAVAESAPDSVFAELIMPREAVPYPELVRKAMSKTAEDRGSSDGVDWIEPPLNLFGLKAMVDQSTILPQCCTAYGDNIAGFGLSVKYIGDVDGNDENAEHKAEWDKLQSVLETLSVESDIADVFSEAVKERERCGIAYIEVIRNLEGNVVEIQNLLDTDTVRKSKADSLETAYTFYSHGKPVERRKRFRRYRQELNGKTVYFKELGDPRTMDWRTGKYTNDPLELEYQANELFELKIGNEHYGKIRWAGQILCIDGSHAAEVLNCSYFHNGRHTPMMIMVAGGHLTSKSREEIKKYLSAVKGENGQHAFLLMEFDAKKGTTAFDEEKQPRVEIKDLGPMLQTDALFGKYLDDNRKKVQSAFRLPDVYVAYTTSYNKATVYAAIQLTEQQVFEAERKSLEWKINNQLLNSYAFKHVKVEFNAPSMTDDDALFRLISLYAQYGGLTPNKAKEGLYEALGEGTAENYDGEWGDIPIPVAPKVGKSSDDSANDQAENEPSQPTQVSNAPTRDSDTDPGKQGEKTEVDSFSRQVDAQVEKAMRNSASDQTLYVLRETRRLLKQLAKQQGGATNG